MPVFPAAAVTALPRTILEARLLSSARGRERRMAGRRWRNRSNRKPRRSAEAMAQAACVRANALFCIVLVFGGGRDTFS